MLITNSRCFRVMDRAALASLARQEQGLRDTGVAVRGDSAIREVARIDYIVQPTVLMRDEDAGGSRGGGIFSSLTRRLVGAAGIGIDRMEVQVMLTLVDAETAIQEAIAEGSARKEDIAVFGLGFGRSALGVGGSYESTDMGKLVMAAFLDAYNNLLGQLGMPGS